MIYIIVEQWPSFFWHYKVDNKKQSPKIDFLTTKIKQNIETNEVCFKCFDRVSHLIDQKLYQLLANTSKNYLVDISIRNFAMESIKTILELKFKTSMINETRLLENLNLKAIKILRCQFY